MPYSGFDISNKSVLVTGGTSGIGKAIALGLAAAGAKVMAGSTNPDKVATIAAELGSPHGATQLDVTSSLSVRDAVAETVKKFGRLDAVIHAAGIIKKQPSLEMPPEEFSRIVHTNLTGSFIVAQEAARVMKDQPRDAKNQTGSLVFIASLTSFVSLSDVLAYGCSKSGILGLVNGLANEWAVLGIRVNAIAPGIIPTDLNRKIVEGTPRGDWMKAHTPLARFGAAEEMVGAALYLISPSASFTTGETIRLDGGYLSRGVGI
jgi:NAD(P)-dependent dehydrogenase (short-subunit alcohol dehydrogenase family)